MYFRNSISLHLIRHPAKNDRQLAYKDMSPYVVDSFKLHLRTFSIYLGRNHEKIFIRIRGCLSIVLQLHIIEVKETLDSNEC